MIYTKLIITYASDYDQQSLEFAIRNIEPAQNWAKRVLLAQALNYPIDDPSRFYGFGEYQTQEQQALDAINQCIDTINQYQVLVPRPLASVTDQDYLNQLHHVFEQYHGLLDQQTHEFWQQAPESVRQALANLNILVHRCESLARGAEPRQVVTYFGLPKTELLSMSEYEYFTDTVDFGTVYLNYCEIGKTLENLAEDLDQYIGDDAFQPFRHYSADFNVQFWTADTRQLDIKRANISQYYDEHQEFFQSRGLMRGHPYLKSGSIPVADIVSDTSRVIDMITHRQWVSKVEIL